MYAIRERGQVMGKFRCPECHAAIGFDDHSVLDTNQAASELMD